MMVNTVLAFNLSQTQGYKPKSKCWTNPIIWNLKNFVVKFLQWPFNYWFYFNILYQNWMIFLNFILIKNKFVNKFCIFVKKVSERVIFSWAKTVCNKISLE